MKMILVAVLLVLFVLKLSAQAQDKDIAKYKTVTLDTINLRGYVYNFDGSPAVGADVRSSQRDTVSVNDYATLTARTDKNGFFKINGAKLYDMIAVDRSLSFANKGSRYMVIYLPIAQQPIMTLAVTANRTHVKPSVSYTIKLTKEEKGVRYEWFEKEPEFIGDFKKVLLNNLTYPKDAIENSIEGTVEVAFTIFKSGAITDVKILKGLGYGCDDEVIMLLTSLPKWKPAIDGYRPIDTRYIIEIEFKLTD